MKQSQAILFFRRYFIHFVTACIILFATHIRVNAQEPPPRPLTVTVSLVQNLSFGAFYQGTTGGSVIISSTGSRSSTGDVVLLGMGYTSSTGLYDLVANPGTLVSVANGPDAVLTGSNGGTMTLKIGSCDPVSPFIITTSPPASTQLRIGGTLTVGNPGSNPPGNYSGSFNIIFVQE
jgi:hypothetical protein